MAYVVLSFRVNGLSTSLSGDGHIRYRVRLLHDEPDYFAAYTLAYLCCTMLPFALVRSVSWLWLMSLAIGGSAVASHFIYGPDSTFPSTWCFFAAWISILLGAFRVKSLSIGLVRAHASGSVKFHAGARFARDDIAAISQAVELV
jgi:hypothetical protein